jgi:hypothetical protein
LAILFGPVDLASKKCNSTFFTDCYEINLGHQPFHFDPFCELLQEL